MLSQIQVRKLIICGSNAELLEYQKNDGTRSARAVKENTDEDKYNQNSINRAKRRLKQLIQCNHAQYGQPTRFLTLTRQRIQSYHEAKIDYHNFIKRINKSLSLKAVPTVANDRREYESQSDGLKYLNVIEFQQRGAPHHHTLLFNFPYIKNDQQFFHDYWGTDRLRIEPVSEINGTIKYLSKYLSKQWGDKRFFRQKRFNGSIDLKQPTVIQSDLNCADKAKNDYNSDALIQMFSWTLNNWLVKETSFQTEFNGTMHQKLFQYPFQNISDLPGLMPDCRQYLDKVSLVV